MKMMTVNIIFKDVVIIIKIVSNDEHIIDLECKIVVKRLDSKVTKFEIDNCVCMLKRNSHANRARVLVKRCHFISVSMSFEKATIISLMYLCFICFMYHVTNLKEDQFILIHSAINEVNIVCIQLTQYKKTEIYVTVEIKQKRQFLENTHDISRSRMFFSR